MKSELCSAFHQLIPRLALPSEPGVIKDERDREENPKKRKRGQNTHRKHPQTRDISTLCPSYAKGSDCPFGDRYLSGFSIRFILRSCKFSHSIPEYLAQKDTDIGDVCPVFEAIGKCENGWRCRWLKGHLVQAEDSEGGINGWKLLARQDVVLLGLGLISEGGKNGL